MALLVSINQLLHRLRKRSDKADGPREPLGEKWDTGRKKCGSVRFALWRRGC